MLWLWVLAIVPQDILKMVGNGAADDTNDSVGEPENKV